MAAVRRTATRLADGRELLYYDDSEPYASGGASRELHDPRDLPPVETASVARRDPLTGEWVTIAAHRMGRTFLPPADECPLCPSRAGHPPTEVPADAYDVVVFENRFPSFAGPPDAASTVDGEPLWPQQAGGGRCEVMCFTGDHHASFARLDESRVDTVLAALGDRTRELSRVDGVAEVFCFENRGTEIGVTLHHPHGQVYAYPFVTPRTRQLLAVAAEHRERTGGDLVGDVLAAERRAGHRVVTEGEGWTAYVPAAARWPVEVHLVPHRAVPDLAGLIDTERAELARLYLDLVRRVEAFFDGEGDGDGDGSGDLEPVPYIAGWHQAPVGAGRELTRLHLRLFSIRRAPGRLKYLAGSESGAGAWINDTTPERIAERLRAVR